MSTSYVQAEQDYGLPVWGEGFFAVNQDGEVCVRLEAKSEQQYSLVKVLEMAKAQGLSLPLLIRFPQLIKNKITQFYTAFANAFTDAQYKKSYTAVYPIKVNQQRSVVATIINYSEQGIGLEAGSKAELLTVMALAKPGQVVVCNGYKDAEYIELALLGQQLGLCVYLIIEKMTELSLVLTLAKQLNVVPCLGIRVRLASIAYGKWQNTGGSKAKFGLTTAELVNAVEILRSHNCLAWCRVLHFHMGSQIPNLRDIQAGLREGVQYYCELRRLGLTLEIIDVGGGLGVDYQGTQSRNECSMNYNMEDYARTVVQTFIHVCREQGHPEPHIITECGRAMVAQHSVLITNVIDMESPIDSSVELSSKVKSHELLGLLEKELVTVNSRTVVESYHESQHYLRELQNLFAKTHITLEQKAYAEGIYWKVIHKILGLLNVEVSAHRVLREEIVDKISHRYFMNLSVFRSLPDVWAINQVFPIVPLSLLHKPLTQQGVVRDLTCDSDGRIDQYVFKEDVHAVLTTPQFTLQDAPYFGFFLVGAYQETLGDIHNLFGAPNSCDVELKEGELKVISQVAGETIANLISQVDYEPSKLLKKYDEKFAQIKLDKKIQERYEILLKSIMQGASYLKINKS